LRREAAKMKDCCVESGDLLILKDNSKISDDERVTCYVHLTHTGFPEDSTFLEKLATSKEFTFRDVKELILEWPQMEFAKDVPIERIRLRTKQQNGFFGDIYRDND
jgi:hypothetical protein